jgi:hypothetical protein
MMNIGSSGNPEWRFGSGLETIGVGGSLTIEIRDRNASVDYIPKAETRHFCLMPRETKSRVMP